MTIQPRRECACGLMPILTTRIEPFTTMVMVKCSCGHHGAAVFYKKPEHKEWAEQSAVDGWDLG